jgi:2-methylcitrate dehydratase PrpD
MAESSSTQAVRDWMHSTTFEDIPEDVRHLAMLALYDGIGCHLACSLLPVAHRAADFAKAVGGPPDCTMIGFPQRTSVLNAAQVNGTLGHADEVDVIEGDGRGAHILASIMPAALAAGQVAGASGKEVIRAVILGYEFAKRVHRAGARGRRETGRTGSIDGGNTMGSVAAAGISFGLSPDQMEKAISLAATMASGINLSHREREHMTKSFVRGGLGARNGVAAALMAKVGYDAPRDILDGVGGFFHDRAGVEEPGPELLAGLGEEYSILQVFFKRASAGGPNQAPRQVLLELMSENGLVADDIEGIHVEVEPRGFETMTSVPHPSVFAKNVLAAAAVYGGIGFREAHQKARSQSPEVLSLRERITIQPRTDWTGEYAHFHTAVTVKTKNSREFYREADYRRMDEADLDAKFKYLVGLRAGEAKAKELAQVLKHLDTVGNIADVMVQLELPEASIDQV